MNALLPPLGCEPEYWNVAFARDSEDWWAKKFLRWQTYKHVRAYAYVPGLHVWVLYDVSVYAARIIVIADSEFRAAMAPWLDGADVIRVRRLPDRERLPLGHWCTSALRHLLRLPGRALSPDGFYRDCLANGGTRIDLDGQAAPLRTAAP